MKTSIGFNRIDAFALLNLLLFLLLTTFRYQDRFIRYFGSARVHEFFAYAIALMLGIFWLWSTFRSIRINIGVLAGLELGILMHFFGAFIQFDDGRLYDQFLFGLRYDKYVHFVNAVAVTCLVNQILKFKLNFHVPLFPLQALILGLIVLGLGALVEIGEYVVVLTVPGNGVGDYDNNMQDLISNLVGTCLTCCYLGMNRANR